MGQREVLTVRKFYVPAVILKKKNKMYVKKSKRKTGEKETITQDIQWKISLSFPNGAMVHASGKLQ